MVGVGFICLSTYFWRHCCVSRLYSSPRPEKGTMGGVRELWSSMLLIPDSGDTCMDDDLPWSGVTTDHSPTKSEDAGYISLLSRVFTFTSILLMSSALTSFRNSYLSCSCNIVLFSLRIFSWNIINTIILLKDQA